MHSTGADTFLPHKQTNALTARQERRLRNYLEEQFLELTRGYKTRSEPASSVPTLQSYLDSAQQILAMILRIPPVDPSTSLRTAFLLRFTNDVLSSVSGYSIDSTAIPILYDWLDDLDQAWLMVLQTKVWDPENGPIDLVLAAEAAAAATKSSPLTQTERTRLRSLLLGGTETLEEWLATVGTRPALDSIREEDEEDAGPLYDVRDMLEGLGLENEFDQLFWRTLRELGLGGQENLPIVVPEIQLEDEDDSDMMEVVI
ncbi:hypothetical protein R3P38DRAFT_2909914 [Favolaschia claudopus]|uniref:Uncharacterized protein n=1 Tax=Favolaschia claudopus TaxID=2862362 RepID=A0AAW0CCK4_9AGAR